VVYLFTASFNIQKFYMVLGSVWIREQTAVFAVYVINWLFFIAVVESVYSVVRTDPLYLADYVWSLNDRGGKCLQRGTDWSLIFSRLRLIFKQPWWKVFTARYGLIPYIKHITFGL